MTTAQTLLDDRSNPLKDKIELKILENTGLANDTLTHTLLPYPIDEKYIEKNKNLYSLHINSVEKNRYYQEIFNNYAANKNRIGINIEILDIEPPKSIIKDLLSNYKDIEFCSDSDSDS